jgi:two-component system, OmpR family, phosphate regulon sensor histidine kinase PhoR
MSTRSRLQIFIVAIVLMVLACSYWAERRARNSLRVEATRQLEQDVSLLARVFVVGAVEGLDSRVDRLSQGLPFRITVTDLQGTVLADSAISGEELRRLENHGGRSEFVEAARGRIGTRFRYSTSTGRWLLYAAAPLESGDGLLRLAIELPPAPWISSELGIPALVLAASFLLVGATLWLPAMMRLTRSKETLRSAVHRVGAGEPITAIPIASDEELGDLARDIEALSNAVSLHTSALESERQHLNSALSSMSEAVLLTDVQGRIVKVNRAFRDLFGIDKEPVGCRLLEVVRSLDMQSGVDLALRQGQLVEIETRFGEKTLLARFSPIDSHDSGGAVVAVNDVTRLRKLESLRRDFVSNVSHELRTPLTSIEGYTETLLAEEGFTSVQRSFLQKINRNAQLLSQILADLLELAQLEGGARPLEHNPIAFRQLMSELEEAFAPQLAGKAVQLVVKSELGDDCFLGSEQHIKRVLYNLLDNALKFTDQGQIEVRACPVGGEIQFSVADTGIGISAEDLGRIFERFYRAAKDRSRETGGAGIGLALVRHIVELHEGRVWAESRQGKGTTVFFTLPQRLRT